MESVEQIVYNKRAPVAVRLYLLMRNTTTTPHADDVMPTLEVETTTMSQSHGRVVAIIVRGKFKMHLSLKSVLNSDCGSDCASGPGLGVCIFPLSKSDARGSPATRQRGSISSKKAMSHASKCKSSYAAKVEEVNSKAEDGVNLLKERQ